MSVIRAQAILRAVTGMARDNCVNTFHFEGLINDTNLFGIAQAVIDFYAVQPTGFGSSTSVDEWISTAMSHVTVKLYDATNDPPNPPLLVSGDQALAPTRQGGANLPEEVAGCLSFAGAPEAGLIQSRRRGRVYIGPLRDTAMTYDSGVGMTKLSTGFQSTLLAAGKKLAVNVDSFAEWVVYSRPYAGRDAIERPGRTTLPAIAARPGTTVNIDQVSVDDAPDTQRRRGKRPTARVTQTTAA